ncbi:MAG TPA: trypsin-like peptidase domain-containing protein [Polyangiales bacterium]|nr:trypsin-like peptidase domain-containing protein [Polyangiales bacterium]
MRRFLVFASVAFLLSCARPPAAQPERRSATEPAGHAAEVEEPGCARAADFGERFIEAAKAVRPALVAVRPGKPGRRDDTESSVDGTPLDVLMRAIPMQREKPERRGGGSGVVIDDRGNILTSNHVVEGASTLRVQLLDGRELSARLVATDAKTDLAVINAAGQGVELQPAQLGDSDELQVGEWVISCGAQPGPRQVVYAGMVNAVGRGSPGIAEYEDFIQTDAAVHPRASGGPLVDGNGRVIGITTVIASENGASRDATGFAMPINMARSLAEQLLTRGKIVRGSIGVYVANVSDELAHSFGFRGNGGALVQDVAPESSGARAGLAPGDIIVDQGGRPVANAAALRTDVASLAPGTKTQLRVFRDGKQRAIDVEIEELATVATASGAGTAEPPRWGMELAEITPELRKRLDLGDSQRGAVVLQVIPNSAADDVGLRAGDLIARVGEHDVQDADHARRLLLTAKAPVRVRIEHDRRGSFVILNGPE